MGYHHGLDRLAGNYRRAGLVSIHCDSLLAIGYDTIYALQDREDDRRIGVKSSALLFGSSAWIAVGTVFCAMLLLLGLAGWLADIGWIYYAALTAIGAWCLRQALQLRQTVTTPTAFRMFQQHVWVGTAVFIGMIAGFLL